MTNNKRLINPPLNPGDTIGIIAPAGVIADQKRFDDGVKILKEMGFHVKFPRDLWPGDGYLSAPDSERILEFNTLWNDPEVKALLSLRGGFGCLRMLEGIDLKAVAANPKSFIGFSDITILHTYLTSQTSLTTLHGPVLTSLVDCTREALERFYQCLRGNWHTKITNQDIEILRNGEKVGGTLTGGNLSSLVTLLGTQFDESWKGKIVILEDINEPLYRIDRMLTQLSLAGKFVGVRAILMGDFSYHTLSAPLDRLRHQESIWKRILELTSFEKTVVWGNFPIGHFANNFTLPLGIEASLDSASAELNFTTRC
jgi:muramoyltetrapeptide carboxypeptidase